MAQTTIDRLIINSPYTEPSRHWRYQRETHPSSPGLRVEIKVNLWYTDCTSTPHRSPQTCPHPAKPHPTPRVCSDRNLTDTTLVR